MPAIVLMASQSPVSTLIFSQDNASFSKRQIVCMYELLTEVQVQLSVYERSFPGESFAVQRVREHLQLFGNAAFKRSCAEGHVTASGLVYDAGSQEVLIIHHRILNRWLQPGGHLEDLVPLHISAAREVEEETGVVVSISEVAWTSNFLFDVDIHEIPTNEAKGEYAHLHYDFLYVFEGDAKLPLRPQLEEVHSARWIPRHQLDTLGSARLCRVMHKLNQPVTP